MVFFRLMLSRYFPNKNPPLLFVMVNFYLGFYVAFQALKIMLGGDFFDEVMGLIQTRQLNQKSIVGEKTVARKIIMKFFVYFFIIFFSLILILLIFPFASQFSYDHNASKFERNDVAIFLNKYNCPPEYGHNITFFKFGQETVMWVGDSRNFRMTGSVYCEPLSVRLYQVSGGENIYANGSREEGTKWAFFYVEDKNQRLASFGLHEGDNSSLSTNMFKEALLIKSIDYHSINKSAIVVAYPLE